ncbi:MAG: hypothetical protein IJ164_04360 [Duodenibacillus sp.]|nr:hypothetical protein [Duodenibacillus sp.]
MGGVKHAVKKVTRSVGKVVKYVSNPIRVAKDTLRDPVKAMTLGLYSPVARAKAKADATAKAANQAAAESERQNAQTQRRREARTEEQTGDNVADSTAVMLSTQNLLNSQPTLLTLAQADDSEVKRRLGRGNRVREG